MKKIIIIIIIFVIILWGAGWYLYMNKDKINNPNKNITKSDIKTSIKNIDEEADKIFLDKEIQLKINFLNKALLPNYLKIVDFKDSNNILWYKDPNVTWYVFKINYDINPKSLADYDVNVRKGSLTVSDYNSKSKLYKKNIKRKLKTIYYPAHGYDRFVKIGLLGYMTKENGVYTMYEMWDYLKNTFAKKSMNIKLLSQIDVLKDYFNYMPIFFNKKPKEIENILNEVEKEMKDPKFSQFAKVLKQIYFKD